MQDKVTIIGVDKDKIEKDNSFPTAYAIYLNLSGDPSPIWVECFDYVWENSLNFKKREVEINNNQLRLIFDINDDLQQQINYVKKLVQKTNECVGRCKRQEVNERKFLRERNDEIERIKRKLRCISV